MSAQPDPTFNKRISNTPYPVIFSCIGLLALGGAAGTSVQEATEPTLGYGASVCISAVPCVAALFAIGMLIKYPWAIALRGSIVLVVGGFAFEEFPKLLNPHLGSGFVCHLVGGIAAMIIAFVTYVMLTKLLVLRSERDALN